MVKLIGFLMGVLIGMCVGAVLGTAKNGDVEDVWRRYDDLESLYLEQRRQNEILLDVLRDVEESKK